MRNFLGLIITSSIFLSGCTSKTIETDREPASSLWRASPASDDQSAEQVITSYKDGWTALNRNQLYEILQSLQGRCNGKVELVGGSLWVENGKGDRGEMKLNWDVRRDFHSVALGPMDASLPKLGRTWLGKNDYIDINLLMNPDYYKHDRFHDPQIYDPRKATAFVIWGYLGGEKSFSRPGSLYYVINIDENTKGPTKAHFETVVKISHHFEADNFNEIDVDCKM